MTDYLPLIARAVEGLDRNTGEARRALYERARTALVAQLRSTEPPLPETDITKERLALEDAIRKVEADAARRSRAEREQRPPAAPSPNDGPIPAADTAQRSEPEPPKQTTAAGAEASRPDATP